MNPFVQVIEQWRDFYISLITASATLLGLLFIGVSLNPSRMQSEADYRSSALQAFISFIYTLILGFMFVIPNLTPSGLGLPLVVFGIFGLLQTLGNASSAARSRTHIWSGRRILIRFSWPIVAFVGLVVVALILMGGACSNAWQLLLHSDKAE